jgi:hypothetical protein
VRGGCTLSRVDSEEAIALISGLIDSLRVELAQYGYPIVGAKLQYAIDFQMEDKPLPERLEPILVRFCHELCRPRGLASPPTTLSTTRSNSRWACGLGRRVGETLRRVIPCPGHRRLLRKG